MPILGSYIVLVLGSHFVPILGSHFVPVFVLQTVCFFWKSKHQVYIWVKPLLFCSGSQPHPQTFTQRGIRELSLCVYLWKQGRQAHRAESQASRSLGAAPSRAAHQYGPEIRASVCSALSAANRWRATCPAQTLRHPTGAQKKGTNSELVLVTLF